MKQILPNLWRFLFVKDKARIRELPDEFGYAMMTDKEWAYYLDARGLRDDSITKD